MNQGETLAAILSRHGDDALIVTDGHLRIREASAEAASLAERPREQMRGLSLIAALGSAPLDELGRAALAVGEPRSGEAALGRMASRQFEAEAVPLASGDVLLWLHEVTAARRAAQARRDVVANISHELRTPLASIKLLAETVSSGAVDDAATMADFATQIEREVDHLAQLVDELLDLSMIESGETKLAIEPIDPEEVVAGCVERITPVAERREVTVRRLPPGGPPEVRAAADQGRLGQALLNLAHNAIKYSHHGGEVRIGWSVVGDRVRFGVADDGIGVPESHQARIFERFYKVDRSRAREPESEPLSGSAGLGLAIVRHIAEAHRGGVGLESAEGVGSTFWIEVPRAA